MKKLFLSVSIGILVCLTLAVTPCFAGKTYQDFEPDNGSDTYGWTWGSTSARLSSPGEPAHLAGRSFRVKATEYWNGTAVQSQVERWRFNATPSRNDRLDFYIYALASNNGNYNVGVQFFDQGKYHNTPFEVWTTNTANYGKWTELYVLFSQLPSDFDLSTIDKIQFINYWPGTYYFDDISVIRRDRQYQSFEPDLRSGSTVNEYGWKWNDADYAGFSSSDEPAHEGLHSWKLVAKEKWGGTGLQSQEKRLLQTSQGNEQTFWHVDLNPAFNDRLTLWVYALPENGLDNNLAVQFYDHDKHATDDTKAVAWTKETAKYGAWTRLEVLFSGLPSTLNLNDIDKIQIQVYWSGTYYFDDIRASSPPAKFDKGSINQGTLQWAPVTEAGNYYIEESFQGSEGPWHLFWSSAGLTLWTTSLPLSRLSKTWYRIKWIENDSLSSLAYTSDWSEIAQYAPTPPLIKTNRLTQGILEWDIVPLANEYEVQAATEKNGPWSLIYKGAYPESPLSARFGEWYRLRALNNTDTGNWSPAQMYEPQKGFVKADGTLLRNKDGLGEEIILRGVNLGGCLLIEKWLTGLGAGDTPNIDDDWTIRNNLKQRFGDVEAEKLLAYYRDTYLSAFDFDRLMDMNINCVRLPIFYRILQDGNGNWLRNQSGEIDFGPIDRIVNACADRAIYVLLDLHGAPGSQSNEAHTGRASFNKLFEDSPDGERYRTDTVNFWKALAQHYKDAPMVVGYDLLNEPIGAAPHKENLWSLYDRIYQAIREVDPNHLIVMEGIWYPDPSDPNKYILDWDTLPHPSEKGWSNIMYQFHYYLWDNNENLSAHQAYMDGKIAEATAKQPAYYVPVMIGEFYGFNLKQIWDYYLEKFTRAGWSWTSWTYKLQDHPSEWGLYTNKDYDDALPKFRESEDDGSSGDSEEKLREKFGKFNTQEYHAPNVSLIKLLENYFSMPLSLNRIGNQSAIEGKNLFFPVSARYSGTGTLTYRADNLPAGATFLNQRFSWTPAFGQAGTYNVDFMVTDGTSTDSETITIRVANTPAGILTLTDTPDPFSPNGDRLKDTTLISASFNHSVTWQLKIISSTGIIVKTFTGQGMNVTRTWNGINTNGATVKDGVYTYTLTGIDTGGDRVTKSSTVTVDTIEPKISNVADYPDPFLPRSGQKSSLSFELSEPAYVRIRVLNSSGSYVKGLVDDSYVTASKFVVQWDGRNSSGNYVAKGRYTYKIWVWDKASNRAIPYPSTTTVRVN